MSSKKNVSFARSHPGLSGSSSSKILIDLTTLSPLSSRSTSRGSSRSKGGLYTTPRFSNECKNSIATIENYKENGIVSKELRLYPIGSSVGKRKKKKNGLVFRSKIKSILDSEIDGLLENEAMYMSLCESLDKREKKEGMERKKKNRLKQKGRDNIILRNMTMIGEFEFAKQKKKVGEMRKKWKMKRINVVEMRKKLKSASDQTKLMRFQETERKIAMSRDKKQKKMVFKKKMIISRKWNYLVELISRMELIKECVIHDRKIRRKKRIKNSLEMVVKNLIIPRIAIYRSKKAKKNWRMVSDVWGFSWLYIRILKRQYKTDVILHWLREINASSTFHLVYIKFLKKVKFVQRLVKRYALYKKSKIKMALLMAKIEESRLIVNKNHRKNLMLELRFPARQLNIHPKDDRMTPVKHRRIRVRNRLKKSSTFANLNVHLQNQLKKKKEKATRVVYFLPTNKMLKTQILQEYKKTMKSFCEKIKEYYEFQYDIQSKLNNNDDSKMSFFYQSDSEPSVDNFPDREVIHQIVKKSFTVTNNEMKKINREIEKSDDTYIDPSKLQVEYENDLEELNNELDLYFRYMVFQRYETIFDLTNDIVEKILFVMKKKQK